MRGSKLILPFQREIWEHQGSFYGVFAALGALILVLAIFGLVQAPDPHHISIEISDSDFEFNADGDHDTTIHHWLNMGLKSMVVSVLHIFVLVSLLVTFFYLLGSLYDDRKDRSILFWKSMPVSEVQNVATKFFTGVFIVPIIALAIGLVTALLLGLMISIRLPMLSDYSFIEVWRHYDIFSALLTTLVFIFATGLWLMPFCGWLMLASSVAKKSPFIWALAPPILLVIAEKLLLGKSMFLSLLGRYMPDIAFIEDYDNNFNWETMVALVKPFLVGPQIYLGLVVSLAFLLLCIWLRNNRYEF